VAIPPTDTCHQSILDDILQEADPIVFEFDAQGGIHRLLGSIEDFRKIYRCLCDSCFRKIGLALLDCLKRAEEVARNICGRNLVARDGKTSML
jgi:hypothetical protein